LKAEFKILLFFAISKGLLFFFAIAGLTAFDLAVPLFVAHMVCTIHHFPLFV
jgi:hypothetical protein